MCFTGSVVFELLLVMIAGGDWGLARTASVFVEGSEFFTLEDCLFTRVDGSAVMLSAYNRNATIQRNEVCGLRVCLVCHG